MATSTATSTITSNSFRLPEAYSSWNSSTDTWNNVEINEPLVRTNYFFDFFKEIVFGEKQEDKLIFKSAKDANDYYLKKQNK